MAGGGGTEKDHFTSEGDRGQASTGPHSVLGMRCGNCGGLDCSQSLSLTPYRQTLRFKATIYIWLGLHKGAFM